MFFIIHQVMDHAAVDMVTGSQEVVFSLLFSTWAAWMGKNMKDSTSDARTSTETAIGISLITSPHCS